MMLKVFPKRINMRLGFSSLFRTYTTMNNKKLFRLGMISFRPFGANNAVNTVKIKFVDLKNNSEKTVDATIGDHLLEVAHKNEIDLEGACEASLACSTCHLILEERIYKTLDDPCEEEDDLLDLAYGLTMTSRLGCQVKVTKDMEGMTVQIPSASRNFYVDGHVPKPH